MAAARTLVVMEGGHPWGFRIEGGAEVREPITVNKVLSGGKAYCHGIEVGDIVRSINGEKAVNMTISRARHLVRTSDDLLILEVTRPGKELLRIPEIRVISPNENLNTSGRGFQWEPNEVLDTQRYMMGTRSMPTEGGSLRRVISRVPPMPPPKPARRLPLTARNPPIETDPAMFTHPGSPSRAAPPLTGRSKSPAVASGYLDGTAWNQSQTSRQSTRSATPIPRNPIYPGNWTFTLYSPPSSPRPGEVLTQRRNTGPAPIKPTRLSGYLFAGRPGVVDSESFGKTDRLEGKQFRQQRTTDTGSVDGGLSSNTAVLPLSSTSRTTVSENQFARGNRYDVAENPYDLLPIREMLNLQGQSKSSVHYQNSYNNNNNRHLAQLEKTWSKKIEDLQTGYDSSSSIDDSNMYADYDFLPHKPLNQNNLRNSPRQHIVLGDGNIFRDQVIGRGDQLVFPDKRFGGVTSRQRLDEENLRRKLEIERVMAEEKRRRHLKDLTDSTARRHSDYFTPTQRSSLLMDRFSDDEIADALARPLKRVHTKIRGKARALHTFRAQSYRELPFKRNDIIYILRQVDKNWFEGERHGMVGIFPITYVEVLTSLDDARATAELREGSATAIYPFRAHTERELPLREGDVVTLIRRVDNNWYEGRLGRRQGIFPITYVVTQREPETPMVTPMSSQAPTPMPGTPASCQSPVSSLYSVGPEIPSAPMSPLDSEFYESDWDTASSIGALQTGRPLHKNRPTSPALSQISDDREVTPVSPFTTGPVNRYSYDGLKIRGQSLPRKSSMAPYSHMADRELAPVRGVTSPTPTGSAYARYDRARIVNPSPGLQTKPSSLAYTEISDHEITPVREVTSPTPTGSTYARHSLDGARIIRTSSGVQPKPLSLASIEISDHEITPVREITSPTPTGLAYARYFVDGTRIVNPSPGLQPKPSSLAYTEISDREIMRVRGVTSPPPTGSPIVQYSDKKIAPQNGPTVQSTSLQPKPSLSSYNKISDLEVTPVRGVASPTPSGLAITRYSIDKARITNQNSDLQTKPSSLGNNQISDRDIRPVRGVTSPTPTGSVNASYSLDEARIINKNPGLQPKPPSLAYNKIAGHENTPARRVTSPTPTGSVNAGYSLDEARIIDQNPGLQPKLSSVAYNKIADHEITPDRRVTSPTPTGSVNAGYSLDEARIIDQNPGLQLKPSSLTYSKIIISDGEIRTVRGITSPTPMSSATAQYSHRTAPQNGKIIQSSGLQLTKPSTAPESQISDGDIITVRGVGSPNLIVSATAQRSSDGVRTQRPAVPLKPSTLPQSPISDRETVPVKAVAGPMPSGSPDVRLSSEDSKPQKPSLPSKPLIRPHSQTSDRVATPVGGGLSPAPVGQANTGQSSEELKIQNADLTQEQSAESLVSHSRKEEILDPTSVRETDRRSYSKEQTQGQGQGQIQETLGQGQGQILAQDREKSSRVSVDEPVSPKPVAAMQRPPSGRSGSLTLRTLKQKLPFKQQQQQQQQSPQSPTEGRSRDRQDGFSKSPETPNPYMRCRAVHDYKPQNIDELELIRGDVIYVMEKCEDGWFVGISDKTKKFGSFPGNFVRPAW